MVLGLDDAASGAALAGDVAVDLVSAGVLGRGSSRYRGPCRGALGAAAGAGETHRSTSSPRSFSILTEVGGGTVGVGLRASRCCRRRFGQCCEFRSHRALSGSVTWTV